MTEIYKKTIPELPDIETYLDDRDQFVVFDERDSSSDSTARRVSYEKIKTGIIANITTPAEMKGIDYYLSPDGTILHITYDDYIADATEEKSGLMSAEDKALLNNIVDSGGASLDSFNAKFLNSNQTDWEVKNINKIQGVGRINTLIDQDEEGKNILKISSTVDDSKLHIKDGDVYVPIENLDSGFGLAFQNQDDLTYKLDLDIDYLKEQGIGGNIKAQIDENDNIINKIKPGNNIVFQTDANNPSNLIISSTGSSIDPTPEPTPSTKTFLAYTCLTENTSINKVIETEDILEEGEVFTVYFENGFSNDNRIQAFTLTIGQQNKPIIFNESDRFSSYIINRFATFVKKEEGYFLISADADLGKGIRTSAPNSNGTESLYLYDNTPYTFINDLSGIEINNNQLIELFEEGKIKSELLPDNSGSSSETIDNIIFAKETGRSGNNITVRTNGNYNLNQEKIIGIYFINSVNKLSNLKIDENQYYPIAYDEYQEDNFNNDIILPAQSIGFFIFNNNGDNSNFELLATNSLKDDIPIINNSDNNNITNISQGNNQYSLINNNILENNHIRDDLLSSNIVTNNQLNNYYNKGQIDNLIPTIQGDSPIRINNENNTISIGLNLPSSEDASNLYLNGTGQWSAINNTININEATQSFIINLIYPIGSYFETYYSPNDFNPNSDILWSGGNVYQWVMVSSSTDPNDSTKTIYKWRKDINSEYNDGGLPTN